MQAVILISTELMLVAPTGIRGHSQSGRAVVPSLQSGSASRTVTGRQQSGVPAGPRGRGVESLLALSAPTGALMRSGLNLFTADV
ncbi:hypothetical protein AAFF_G00294160 [Aldrovandia affinis]|uniref:Uncharacterized protein n=1 Tax=Aldrovandia affinis TaxID=143900 RepID=A0AAD7R909_9TELE|nr:hypothetical protein AAFF_G00294160 [Aldrovandia affinis]